MRIKAEKIESILYYRDMPESQRRFFTESYQYGYIEYENGMHTITFFPTNRLSHIKIGFDKKGNIIIDPVIRTKNGKIAFSRDQLKQLFDVFIRWLSSAYKNGFLDFEEDT